MVYLFVVFGAFSPFSINTTFSFSERGNCQENERRGKFYKWIVKYWDCTYCTLQNYKTHDQDSVMTNRHAKMNMFVQYAVTVERKELCLALYRRKRMQSAVNKVNDSCAFFFIQSGARINISDGSSTERIVTITGASEVIFKAFAMIAEKFEEVWYIIFNKKKIIICN